MDYVEQIRQFYKGNISQKEQTRILKQAPTWETALSLFRWFQASDYELNIIHYNVVLRFLGRAKRWDELKFLWDEICAKKLTPTNFTYGTLIDVYGKAGLRIEALQWLKCAEDQGLMPEEDIISTVIHMYVEAREFDQAVEFYRRWRKSQLWKPRKVYTYNTLIDMYGSAGRLAEASVIFSEMLKSGISPDNVTFNTMIHICGSYGGLEEAMFLMNKMEERGFKPDGITYNTLIALHAEKGNVDMALDYFSRMKQDGLRPDDRTYRPLLLLLCAERMIREVESILNGWDGLRTFGDLLSPSIVRMYVEMGLLSEAWVWYETFHHLGGISSRSYGALIDAFGEHGYWLEAEKVFGRSLKPEEEHSLVEYNVMIKAYGIAKQYDKARELFDEMESNGLLPDEVTYNSFIQMLAAADFPDDARCYMKKMQEVGFLPSAQTFNAVSAANGRLGRPVEAEMIYKEMIKMGIEPTIFTYGGLINAFAETGNIEKAAHYFDIMEKAGIAGNCAVYRSLMKGHAKVGWLKGAEETYEKMRGLGDGPDVIASNRMINLYSDAVMIREAELIFNDLKEAGRADENSFASMLAMYQKSGSFDQAFNIVKEIQDLGLITDRFTFNCIIGFYSGEARLKEATEVFLQMLEAGVSPDDDTYRILGTILKKGGIPTETVNQLQIARESGIPHSKQALMVALYSVSGMHGEALEAFEQLKDTSLDLDTYAYNVGIYALGSAGRTDEAFKMFTRMQTKGLAPDVGTYTSMIISYAKAGLVQAVIRMVNKMRYKGFQPNKNTYQTVIDAYERDGKFDLARQTTKEMQSTQYFQEKSDFTEADHPSLSKVYPIQVAFLLPVFIKTLIC